MRETSAYNRRTQGRSLDKQAVFRLFPKNVNQQPKSLAHPHHLHLATFGDSLLSLVYCGHSMTHPAPQNSEHLWQVPSWKGVGRLAWLLSFLTGTNMKVGLKEVALGVLLRGLLRKTAKHLHNELNCFFHVLHHLLLTTRSKYQLRQSLS